MLLSSSRVRLPIYAAVILATGLFVKEAWASHSWGEYHWARTTLRFTLKVGDNLTSTDWKDILYLSSSDWNSPELFGATFTPILTTLVPGQSSRRCSMVQGTTQVCNGAYGKNGWLGLATINVSGNVHITQGSAKMNDSYFSSSYYNNPNERRHVMCQEVAHTFGLAHQSEDGSSQGSCMDYFSNTGKNATSTLSTRPNAHDFEQLAAIYSHLDSTTTVASGTTSGSPSSGVDSDNPNSWGILVSQSKNGRSSTYEAYERDGTKTITHVYWTEEAAARCGGCDHRFDGGH